MTTPGEIWNELKEGKLHALKDLYEQYYQDLFQYGRRMTKDDQLVEDALQETFISVWKYRQTTSVPIVVRHYLLKAFRNQLLRLLSERSVTAYTGEAPDFSFEVAFDQVIIAGEDAMQLTSQINSAIQQLTPRQREIIYYRFFENFSFEEIGVLMNMQTRATYKLAARALQALKELLTVAGFRILLVLFGSS